VFLVYISGPVAAVAVEAVAQMAQSLMVAMQMD
jgi:hypothetical protein